MRISRRRLLRRSAGSLLAAGLWPGVLGAADTVAADPFHFVVLNDLHYQDERCFTWHEGIVKQIKAHKEKIDFCLLVGDLMQDGTAVQLEPVRALYRKLDMPLHVVIGNHDWQSEKDRKPYDTIFAGATNYSFEHRTWQFVGLDSTDGPSGKASVPPATLKWLDAAVPKLDRKKPLAVFTHFPLGPWIPRRSKNADELLERFKDYNLQSVFNGHFHASTERRLGNVMLTTNRCCSFCRANHDGSREKGYFLCQAKDGKITRAFVERNDEPRP